MTLCNMAIEAGGTCGICLPDMVTVDYLWPFIQEEYRQQGGGPGRLSASGIPTRTRTMKRSSTSMFPTLSPRSPSITSRTASSRSTEMAGTQVDQVYIGTCTNGRIEDLREAAAILKGRKVADSACAASSRRPRPTIFQQALAEGIIQIFMDAGFCVTNPTCGACLGMSNGVLAEGEVCASTSNRNFNGRMGKGGMVHLMSPATAAATAVTGVITAAMTHRPAKAQRILKLDPRPVRQ